jgi:ABC-type sugar transport system substrate-binding protein
MRVFPRIASRRALTLVAALGASLTIAACGSDEESKTEQPAGNGGAAAGDKPVELAYFLPIANSFMDPATQGIQDAAKELGANVRIYDAGFDPGKQFNQMQDALASGEEWDAWLVSPVDGSTVAPGVKDATGKGIVVSCLISTCGPDSISVEPQSGENSFVGPDAKRLGGHLGDLTVEACADVDPCNVFLLTIDPKFSVDRAMSKEMQAVLAKHPQIKLTSSTKGGAVDPEVARTTTQDYLQGNKGVTVITSTADQMTRGIELAVKDAGLEGKIKIISLGASKQGTQAVADGRWFANVVRVPYDEGYKAAELAIKAARGEKIESSVTVDKLTDREIIKKDNVEGFEGQWDA